MGFLGIRFEAEGGRAVKLSPLLSKAHKSYAINLKFGTKYTHIRSFRKYTF